MIEENFALAIESVKLFAGALSRLITDFESVKAMFGNETGMEETIKSFKSILEVAEETGKSWMEMLEDGNPLSTAIKKFLNENELKTFWAPKG